LSELKRPGNPNSLEIENHISWDFAEAVNLPHSSQQEVINLYYLYILLLIIIINIFCLF
jgi:hypothetical protein